MAVPWRFSPSWHIESQTIKFQRFTGSTIRMRRLCRSNKGTTSEHGSISITIHTYHHHFCIFVTFYVCLCLYRYKGSDYLHPALVIGVKRKYVLCRSEYIERKIRFCLILLITLRSTRRLRRCCLAQVLRAKVYLAWAGIEPRAQIRRVFEPVGP
jgi:hypothetical protein